MHTKEISDMLHSAAAFGWFWHMVYKTSTVPRAHLLLVPAVNGWPRNQLSAAFARASDGATTAGLLSTGKPWVFGRNGRCGLLQKLMAKCKRPGAGARSLSLSAVFSVKRDPLQKVCLESSQSKDIRTEVFPYHWYDFLGDDFYPAWLWAEEACLALASWAWRIRQLSDYRNSVCPSHGHGLFRLEFILMTFTQRGANCELPLINGPSSPLTFSRRPLAFPAALAPWWFWK